jgi:hypothetical protein
VIHRLVFIDMSKKTKHFSIRLTEEQFKKLGDILIIEQRTKSSLLRDLLCTYMDGNKNGSDKQNQNNSVNLITNL